MQIPQKFVAPPRLLMGPGPSDVAPSVLQAMAQPLVGHLDPVFVKMMDEIKAMLRAVFQTQNDMTFPVSGTGSAGMEFCCVNLLEPGDEVIIGGGSGGAIRLVAPIVNGSGQIQALQSGAVVSTNGGNHGRIRIDTLDRLSVRSLNLAAGKWSIGGQMYVFPPNNPRLDIVEAAGQVIAVGITNAVNVSLPPLAPTNQTIKVQATGFTTNVPVTVAVVPEAGPSARYDGVINVTGTNATIGTIDVIIPAASFCNISVWTR